MSNIDPLKYPKIGSLVYPKKLDKSLTRLSMPIFGEPVVYKVVDFTYFREFINNNRKSATFSNVWSSTGITDADLASEPVFGENKLQILNSVAMFLGMIIAYNETHRENAEYFVLLIGETIYLLPLMSYLLHVSL